MNDPVSTPAVTDGRGDFDFIFGLAVRITVSGQRGAGGGLRPYQWLTAPPAQQGGAASRRPWTATARCSPTAVARRMGHSVAVLLRVYANCIDGQQDTMNGRIDGALGD